MDETYQNETRGISLHEIAEKNRAQWLLKVHEDYKKMSTKRERKDRKAEVKVK